MLVVDLVVLLVLVRPLFLLLLAAAGLRALAALALRLATRPRLLHSNRGHHLRDLLRLLKNPQLASVRLCALCDGLVERDEHVLVDARAAQVVTPQQQRPQTQAQRAEAVRLLATSGTEMARGRQPATSGISAE